MASDLNRDAALLSIDPARLNQIVEAQAALRSLTEALVFDGDGAHPRAHRPELRASASSRVPDWALQQARAGDVAVLTSDNDDRVRALVRLDAFGDVYPLCRPLRRSDRAQPHASRPQRAVAQYQQLEGERSDYQIAFSMLFFGVGVLLLTGAVWVGLSFATRMARPISWLIAAAERVRGGDLAARVPEGARRRGVRLAVARLQPHDPPARRPSAAS